MSESVSLTLRIDCGGTVHCLYDETIDLLSLGTATVTRASHVEPDEAGRWWADLSPMNGPALGPFEARSAALAAEKQWLLEHWLIPPSLPTASNTST